MKNTKTLFLFVFVCSFSQENESIQTDRPDQTETASLVPKRMWQVETGFSYQKNDEKSTTINTPSVLWKYGISENFELRLITEFVFEEDSFDKKAGISPILMGCKIKISNENGILPKVSFIGHLSFPNAASSKFKTFFLLPNLDLQCSIHFQKKFL